MTARKEWADAWPLPITSMAGYAGVSLMNYGSGVFMVELTRAFGWTRLQFSSGLTIQLLLTLLGTTAAGPLIDRVGSRTVALVGVPAIVVVMSLFSLVDGAIWQWWLLNILLGLTSALVSSAVWVKPVVSRFAISRGRALGVVLAGVGVASAIGPAVAAFYVTEFGWRGAYPAIALSWGAVALPLTFFFLKGPPGHERDAAPAAALDRNWFRVLASPTFLSLGVAGGLFSAFVYGLKLHMVPFLESSGLPLASAAALAGLAGIFAIVGRLIAGFLLDGLPTRPLAITTFLLPIGVSLLLLSGHGSYAILVAGIVLLGLVNGAESDILAFLASRRFDQRAFASVYAPLMAMIGASSSLGPLLASALFDARGSYDLFLFAMIPAALVAASLVAAWGTKPAAAKPDPT